jgi:hypothetical protein
MFGKTGLLALIGLFAAFLVSGGFAQESSTHTRSRSSAAVQPAEMLNHGMQPVQPPAGSVARPLSLNRHALMSAASPDLGQGLKGNGPAASGKNYSSLELSKANFLNSTVAKSISLPPVVGPSSIDTHKLWGSKQPNSGRN